MNQSSSDRRKDKRRFKVSLVQANSYVIGSTADLSLGGARIELSNSLPLDHPVRLDLLAGDEVLEFDSTVVHVEKLDENRYSVGLRFQDVDPQTLQRLEKFLAATGPRRRFTLTDFEIGQ